MAHEIDYEILGGDLQAVVIISIAFNKRLGAGLFGGEGLFLATLGGPGRVYLQTLPFSRLADRMKAAISVNRGEHRGVAGLGGGLLKNIISGGK